LDSELPANDFQWYEIARHHLGHRLLKAAAFATKRMPDVSNIYAILLTDQLT
jgi:hypothetical protein